VDGGVLTREPAAMLRPKKRQKFGGFKSTEESETAKEEALQVQADEEQRSEQQPEEEVPKPEPEEAKEEDVAQRVRCDLSFWLAECEKAGRESNVEAAFEHFAMDAAQEGTPEQAVIARLQEALHDILPGGRFELEPIGEFVTDLRLPNREKNRIIMKDELELAVLVHDNQESPEAAEVRKDLVVPLLEKLAAWLKAEPGIIVKEFTHSLLVPILTFETKDLAVTVSVQYPFGVLSSWHIRDLCHSGWPGRFRALARLVKVWARSKGIDSVQDGALPPYGYELLTAAFLQELHVLPALLPGPSCKTFIDAEEALKQALDTRETAATHCDAWRPPELANPTFTEAGSWHPAHFLQQWFAWMGENILSFVDTCKDVQGGCGRVPLDRRYIVSVRDRTQEELREDVASSPKHVEHWSPEASELFLLIEDPLSGDNIGKCAYFKGLCCIRAEVQRARSILEGSEPSDGGLPPVQALLDLPPLNKMAPFTEVRPAYYGEEEGRPHLPQGQHVVHATWADLLDPDNRARAAAVAKANALNSLCWDYAKGRCFKGDACKWVHSLTPQVEEFM